MRIATALLTTIAWLAAARAEPIKLRMATIAPEGSAWARELAAFARDVEAGTHGAVTLKIYYSSVAGDEFAVIDRIKRDQLDGAIGSESCMRLAPSMKVTRIIGLFQSREESAYVLTRLRPLLDKEFLANGFVNLGQANLGPEVLLTRQPITSVADLRKTRFWVWDLDGSLRAQAPSLGLQIGPLPIEQAAHAYDEKRVDGFIAIPSGALAFQWSAQARYLQDLRISYRSGCIFFASRAFDALPIVAQQYLTTAASAKLRARVNDVGYQQDDALLGGLFAKQGLRAVPVSPRFRTEFAELASDARARQTVVSRQLLSEVLSWLADLRGTPTH
ncbi:MAG: dicarboxylate transporter subunit DctP [bacterium]|nr:dicarboxylate transporter subunit DctP [bacterium]